MPQIRVYLSEDNQVTHDLTDETVTVGRLADNTLQIEDGSVSSRHAELVLVNDGYQLKDNGSTNGTFVNGAQVTEVVLKDGDQIRFGTVETVYVGDAAVADSAAPLPQSERAEASIGANSARPVSFRNASPFPKPKEKTDPITLAALAIAVLGALGFLVSVALTMTLQPPL